MATPNRFHQEYTINPDASGHSMKSYASHSSGGSYQNTYAINTQQGIVTFSPAGNGHGRGAPMARTAYLDDTAITGASLDSTYRHARDGALDDWFGNVQQDLSVRGGVCHPMMNSRDRSPFPREPVEIVPETTVPIPPEIQQQLSTPEEVPRAGCCSCLPGFGARRRAAPSTKA
eukprot:2990148-Rhodomonas_salina.1